jgi:hypothetical protein
MRWECHDNFIIGKVRLGWASSNLKELFNMHVLRKANFQKTSDNISDRLFNLSTSSDLQPNFIRPNHFRHFCHVPKEISEWCLKPKSKVSQHPIILLSRKIRAEKHKGKKNAFAVKPRYPSQLFLIPYVKYIEPTRNLPES